MARVQLTMIMKDYDHVAALAFGDVVAEGIDLKVIRDTPSGVDRVVNDPSMDAGETSFSRHLIRLSRGDRSLVGIPIFVCRGFRHRCYYVRRDSGLRGFHDLVGKRVGTDKWVATGTVWTRAALHEGGVRSDQCEWVVGPIDQAPAVPSANPAAPLAAVPPYARPAPTGRALLDLLLEGELDAILAQWPPRGFYEPNSPVVRLFPDYWRVEQQYYRRTGIAVPHHILALRREAFDCNPWVARSLYEALERSKLYAQQNHRDISQTTPWDLVDIEASTELMGPDWWPNGVETNQAAIRTLCEEMYVQGLIDRPLDPTTVFAEFEEVMPRFVPKASE